jgi:hypothetical protein
MRKFASSFPRMSVWLCGGLCLVACGPGNIKPSDLTARERQVQIFEKGQLPSCTLYEELGVIEVESGGSFTPGTFESSLAKLRRAAAERGATGILMLSHSTEPKIDKASGTAMRCLPRS